MPTELLVNFDEFWSSYSMKGKYAEVETPAYFITGWYDNLCHEGWRNFLGLRRAGGEVALVAEVGDADGVAAGAEVRLRKVHELAQDSVIDRRPAWRAR